MGNVKRGLHHVLIAGYTSTISYKEKNIFEFFKKRVTKLREVEGCVFMGTLIKIWFWVMLLHKTAKKFDGINAVAVREYNKYHISNTMGIAVVEMDFGYSLENVGRVIKCFFQRSQSSNNRQRNLVGKNGVIIKNTLDIHYVDYNVNGSNDGTSKNPKFQLKMFF